MGEGLYWDADGRTLYAEPCDGLDDEIERALGWRDFIADALAALSRPWRAADRAWKGRARVLAQSGLHALTLHEDSYGRGHLTVAVRRDLKPGLEALAQARLDAVALGVFSRLAQSHPLRIRTSAWTSAPWSPPARETRP